VAARLLAGLPDGSSVSPSDANAAAMVCALGPGAVRDWERPIALIEQALRRLPAKSREHGQVWHAHLNTCGAVLYRAGRWKAAIDRLREGMGCVGSQGTFHDWVFLAMAHHRLGQVEDARTTLKRARQAHAAEKRGGVWDAAEMDVLLAEAVALVEPVESP
jgi:hypothetical protein